MAGAGGNPGHRAAGGRDRPAGGLGLARQSVQRTADILVEAGWAEYLPNPSHRRAKLLQPTEQGRATVAKLCDRQHAWADAVGKVVGAEDLSRAVELLEAVVAASRKYREKA